LGNELLNSCEQVHEADINIILENGPLYCNILVGKEALANKKTDTFYFAGKSEMRRIITDDQYASCLDNKDIKQN
jgi:hypothetical protein